MNNVFTRSSAMSFIVLLGIVSLFADVTYEGGRSIIGPYLATLGASAALVGFVAGFGELVGYGLRLVSGYLADKTHRYWLITLFGYAINVVAVPLLAITWHWPTAAALIVLERLGKSIRTPARDAMLSQAGHAVGMGWGFGLHQALDQTGAMIGPFVVAFALYLKEGYHFGFAILAIPAFFALLFLFIAFLRYPNPTDLQIAQPKIQTTITQKLFWIYIIGTAFVALGYADFPLIAYHFGKSNILSATAIPVAYGIAMGIDGIIAPIAGRLFDKYGLLIMVIGIVLTSSFAPLVFLGGSITAFIGVAAWSIGMGMQSALMRAMIGNMVPLEKRGSAYGIFNTVYGVSWFIGSVLLGLIYDHSIVEAVIFSVAAQLLSLPWLYAVIK